MQIVPNSLYGFSPNFKTEQCSQGANLLGAIENSKEYAKEKLGANFESLSYRNNKKYWDDYVPAEITTEQVITVHLKNGTVSDGIISLKTSDEELKSIDEISAQINELIDRIQNHPDTHRVNKQSPEFKEDSSAEEEMPELEDDQSFIR